MTIPAMLDKLIFGPLLLLFDLVLSVGRRCITNNAGVLIAFLSLVINLLVLPLYRRADAMQEEERRQALALKPGIDHIKKTFKGNERFMMLQAFYRQNHYKPWYALKGSLSLMLEIPFFIAAYRYLSGLQALRGIGFGPIADMGAPDGLLHIAGHTLNLLPLLMTGINIVSGAIYTRGMPLRSKVQLYGMALVFLVLLYDSPSVLVLYWTMNNVFSLMKNVFCKLRHPGRAIAALCAALGLALLALLLLKMGHMGRIKRFTLLLSGIGLQLPLCIHMILKRRAGRPRARETRGDRALFFIGCAFLTLLLGALIPLDVIRSSPAEFVDVTNYHSSLSYVLSSTLLAAGTFLVWFSIYYYLSGGGVRKLFGLATMVASVAAVIDYTCYGADYGIMSAELQYESRLIVPKSRSLINLLILLAAAGVVWLIWRKRRALLRVVGVAGCVAVLGMSVSGATAVQGANRELLASVDAEDVSQSFSFPLDKSGKNVVVIMLDRGLGRFIPYIMQEKPELMDSFAGFTLYSNTLSYGSHTNVATPSLFGGYEYTPLEMNRRSSELLVDKHDEALRVMPVLFLNSGCDVTVCDPPYAGYSEVPDLSIYDQWPEINTYITMTARAIDNEGMRESNDALRHRNFFCYSLFRASPPIAHRILYNRGRYNEVDAVWTQITYGPSRAHGMNYAFMKDYGALSRLPGYTRIRDEGRNTFMMINNEMTHAPTLLQEPDYVPAMQVDNTDYEAEHPVRVGPDGSVLHIDTDFQMKHYHVNMAAMLRLARWLDYLRENGVYDNTRIIIVSDHGFRLGSLFDMKLSAKDDMFYFCPLLMVKDFDSTEFTVDDTFMTNADTPLLALDGIVENPVNPFTGKALSDAPKRAPEQQVAREGNVRPSENNGTAYIDLHWYANRNNVSDLSAWRVIGDEPED